MGSYYIPSNKLKGESRILYIFTTKSLIYTAAGGLIGFLFYFIFQLIGLNTVGIVFLVAFAVIGYGIGTIKFPTSGNNKIAKNVGGDSIDQVIVNYIRFKKNRKIYTYSIEREEPDYATISSPLDIFNKENKDNKETQTNTKEEK